MKTTQEILDEWDEYKEKHIDKDADWTQEHDDYLNTKWFSFKELQGVPERETMNKIILKKVIEMDDKLNFLNITERMRIEGDLKWKIQ